MVAARILAPHTKLATTLAAQFGVEHAGEDSSAKAARDPVAPARRSQTAQRKASIHHLPDGTPAHSFRTLLDELSTVVRNTCRSRASGVEARSFEIVTTANPKQAHAMQLLQSITL